MAWSGVVHFVFMLAGTGRVFNLSQRFMKTMYRLLLVGMALSVVSGCLYPASGSGTNPVVGAAYGVAGVIDAKNAQKKQKQQEEKRALTEYLEKQAQ
jgi:hypothetical protein